MTVVRCPRCRDEVSVPARASSRALMRCPLCLEQYLLAEALASAPPPLVIIGGEVEQEAIHSPPAGEEYRLAGGSFAQATDDASMPRAATALTSRPVMRVAQRPRRKEKSGVWLLANYVGGGVLGLSLGLLVLWWGFRRDPLEAGPRIAAYVPWIVPAEFRGPPANDVEREPLPTTTSALPSRVSSDQSAASERLQSLPAIDEPEKTSDAALSPALEPPLLGDPSANAVPADDAQVGAAPAGASRPTPPDLTDLLPADWPTLVATEEPNDRSISAVELADATSLAAAKLQRYDEQAKDDALGRRAAFSELHSALGEAGRLASYRPADSPTAPPVLGELEQLLSTIAVRKGALSAAKFLTMERWSESSDGQGLMAAGIVKRIEPAGRMHEIELEVSVRDATQLVPIVTAANAADLCEPGDELVVIGRVVEDPKLNLPRYEGARARVLTAGLIVPAPKQ